MRYKGLPVYQSSVLLRPDNRELSPTILLQAFPLPFDPENPDTGYVAPKGMRLMATLAVYQLHPVPSSRPGADDSFYQRFVVAYDVTEPAAFQRVLSFWRTGGWDEFELYLVNDAVFYALPPDEEPTKP